MEWDKPKCRHCGKNIEKPEEAILALTYKKVFWDIECFVIELEAAMSFIKFFPIRISAILKVREDVDKLKTNENRKELQKFISNTSVFASIIQGIVFIIISGLILFNADKLNLEIIELIAAICLLGVGVMFIFADILYYYNLNKHEKLIGKRENMN
jgi:hypothetical protein